ncbi:class I SAM-dependent methyltransferase [Amycolatopsis vancoresmycina]|uniref:SAM-dependent methyltransferase n=1 Tax=Amycolatopsis vancoresmycina TaxID=208444 RepID=UPI00138AF327
MTALDLQGERVLVNLACGRGGYGLEIARRRGCRVVGIDFSEVAIEQARRRARELRLASGCRRDCGRWIWAGSCRGPGSWMSR